MRLLTLSVALICGTSGAVSAESDQFGLKEITLYPFVASEERVNAITSSYKKVKAGMTAAEVRSLLGEPDEVRPLYEAQIKNGKQIGHTFWYLLRRAQPTGSIVEKSESLVRVSFGSDGRVLSVDRW